MEHEAQCNDLYPGLETEHSDEVGLRLLLHTHQETESEPLASESEGLTTEASPGRRVSPVSWTWAFCLLREGAAPGPRRCSWR